MKVVVYTVILHGYDKLRNHVNLPYDFIAYVDDRSIVPADTNWIIRDIPEEIKDMPMFEQLNYLKHMPHKLFPDYDISVYEDGKISVNKNIQILVDLDYNDNRLLTNILNDRVYMMKSIYYAVCTMKRKKYVMHLSRNIYKKVIHAIMVL